MKWPRGILFRLRLKPSAPEQPATDQPKLLDSDQQADVDEQRRQTLKEEEEKRDSGEGSGR